MATDQNRECSKAEELTVAMKNVTSPAAMYDDFRMTMDASCSWEQLLSPAPLGISVLGDLMVVASSMSDFRLDESGQRKEYKYMRYPESFRASLVQVSNAGYQAFMQAHTNMDQIRLYAANVPSYMKEATKILTSTNAKLITKFLPPPLKRISEAAERSVTLSLAVTQSFEQLIGLICEILEEVAATEGLKERQNEEIIEKKEGLEMTASETHKMLEDAMKHKVSLEKMVEETQNELREARKRMPSGVRIFAMNTLESVSDILSLRFLRVFPNAGVQHPNPPSSYSVGATMTIDPDDERLLEHRKNILEVSSVAKSLYKIAMDGYKKTTYRVFTNQYDGSTHLQKLQDISIEASDCPELEDICEEGIKIIKNLQTVLKSDTPSNAEELTGPIKNFCKKATKLVNKVKSLGNVLPQRTPHMSSTLITSGRASEITVAQAKHHVESAEERLRQVQNSADKAREEMVKLNREYIEQLKEMQSLKVSEIDYKQAIDLLRKGLISLGKLKEHWYGLVSFFRAISNVVEVIMSKSLIDFSTHVETAGTDLDLLDKITLDLIYTSAMKASQASYFVHSMADTYTKVSNKFIMPNVVKLDQMITCDSNNPGLIERKRVELLHACQRDSQGIIDLIMVDKQNLIDQAEERMNTIKQQFAMLELEDDFGHIAELDDF